MFTDDFRRRLALGKYTRWASDLSEDQLAAALWAAGEFGYRAAGVLECLDRRAAEVPPCYAYPRARIGLELLARMVGGERLTADEVIAQVRAVLACWRANHENCQDTGPDEDQTGAE